MIKNEVEFIEGINKREINNDASIYAQILKHERVKRHMTLEDMAKNVCSVSYLCKLENSIIKTNEGFIRALFEKVNLDYNKISTTINDGLTEEVIKNIFFKKDSEIERLYNKVVILPFSSSSQIVKCFYDLAKFDYKAFENDFTLLDNIKFTLGETEAITLLYLQILYSINKNDYLEAYHYLGLIDFITINNQYLLYLITEANLLTAYNLRNYRRFFYIYEKYEKIDQVGYPLGRSLLVKMLYDEIISDEYLDDILNDINSLDLDIIPQDSKLDVIYFMYLIKMKKGKKKELFTDIINKTYYLDARYMGLLAVICYQEDDDELFSKLLELVEKNNFNENDKIHERFVYFILLYKTSREKIELAKYMKEEINPKLGKEICFLYNDIYKEIYCNFLLSGSKYKESYYFLENFLKNFKNKD